MDELPEPTAHAGAGGAARATPAGRRGKDGAADSSDSDGSLDPDLLRSSGSDSSDDESKRKEHKVRWGVALLYLFLRSKSV